MSSTPEKVRWRPRFSLSTFVLLCLALSSMLLAFLMKHDIETLRADNIKLSAELGRLYITDKDKIHILAPQAAMAANWTWHWRVYIPPGRKYQVRGVVKNVPAENFPVTTLGFQVSGEFSLDARLQKDNQGNWEFAYFQGDNEGINYPFDPPGPEFLTGSKKAANIEIFGVDTPLIERPAKYHVLLRVRENPNPVVNGVSISAKDPKPCPGVMLWLEEDPPKK